MIPSDLLRLSAPFASGSPTGDHPFELTICQTLQLSACAENALAAVKHFFRFHSAHRAEKDQWNQGFP
jgi:hypothetical protein